MNKHKNKPSTRGKKGSVTLDNKNNRIRLRFRYNKKRYTLGTQFAYTLTNVDNISRVVKTLEADIRFNTLDESLDRYRDMLTEIKEQIGFQNEEVQVSMSEPTRLYDIYLLWLEHKVMRKEISEEIPINHHLAGQLLKKWGHVSLYDVEQNLIDMNLAASTYNHRLSTLRNFFQWGVKNKYFKFNPLSDTIRKKGKRFSDPKRKPLSKEELTLIINAFETDRFTTKNARYKHSHYAPYIKFMVLTGVRNAEATGLTVEKVDFKNRYIQIDQALARTQKGSHASARVMKETKTGNNRYIPMNEDLYNILEPLCKNKQGNELLFLSHSGKAIDDRMFQRRVFKPILKKLNIEDRVLYVLRHSFGTRAIEQGMTLYEVAQLMGHTSIETTMRNYIHLINRPKNLPGL